jgi:hypothetical protein
MSGERREPYDDERFLRNVREARANGFDLCCSDCGSGIQDDSDGHEMFCPQNPDIDENVERAERWAAKQRAQT